MVFGTSVIWVLAAAVAYFAVGALWYSPVLFAKPWMKALGKKSSNMTTAAPAMVITFLSILLIVALEAYFIHVTNVPSLWRSAYLGAKLWLGFAATTALINNSFQGASKKLFLIDQGYHLVGFVVAAMVLFH